MNVEEYTEITGNAYAALIVDVLYCQIAIGHIISQAQKASWEKALCFENEILVLPLKPSIWTHFHEMA